MALHGPLLFFLSLATLWTCLPLGAFPWWDSHETVRYPLRVVEYLEGWRAGYPYPRWAPDLLGGCGVPFFNFYAPSVFFLASLPCQILGLSPMLGLKLVVGGLALLASWGTYGLAFAETRHRVASLLAALTYTYLPYRSSQLFERGNLSEYAAYSMLPLVLLGYRQLFTRSRPVAAAALASLAHAAVLLSHALSGLYTTGLLALWLTWQVRARPARALLGWCSWGLALGLAAVYLLPAFFERHQVHSYMATFGPFKSYLNTLGWSQALLPSFTPGPLFLTFSLLWALSLTRAEWRRRWRRVHPWMALAWLTYLSLFHWAAPLWRILPFGTEIQFPWRLLGLVGLLSSLGLAEGWAALVHPNSRRNHWVALLLLLGPLWLTDQLQVRTSGPLLLTPEAIRAENVSTCSADEYLPIGVSFSPRPYRPGPVWSLSRDIRVQLESRNGFEHTLRVQAARPGEIGVGIYYFPGWKLSGGGILLRGTDGFVRIALLQPGSYELRLYFANTAFRNAATGLSLLSLLALLPLLRKVAQAPKANRPPGAS